ncbi:MAG TPA: NAD-dependent epimerase/dehydratase family protein, partial [Pyrinomonadaceae bacterium]|nr:NAD-dependent epimerase/dehydratase family protein [Pyrinomonadaceae bacterium]
VEFVHGDIRNQSDLEDLPGEFDVFIEASAEPSVLAGISGSPNYVLQTNLAGTLNCLEFARKRAGSFVFLSTSRVYSMRPLREIKLIETESRFEIDAGQSIAGVSEQGVAEEFPTHLPRSFYGATKLASELIIQEYVETYGLRAVIDRCGVIAGPGQFGKVDQGVFTLWVANHVYQKPLRYTGFGGQGKQVRDLLHPLDLFGLLKKQISKIDECAGGVFNVGGGREISTSLMELTDLCRRVTGNEVSIESETQTSAVDIPLYISDYQKAGQAFSWQPARSVETIVEDIFRWLRDNQSELRPLFA